MATFSDRLKELRKSKGVTQKSMSDLLSINERTYQRYERGESEPRSSTMARLADYFNVSTDYLLGREGY